MVLKIFQCIGGDIILPSPELVLVDRNDGGNLIVNPSKVVWERGELSPVELTHWSFLIAATGRAMLEILPQLEGGCINYWEAGNWALNDLAEPKGLKKSAKEYRTVHLHLLGRSQQTANESLKWGEAPKFPDYTERLSWATNNKRLNPDECLNIVRRVEKLLTEVYGMNIAQLSPSIICENCGYPIPVSNKPQSVFCSECVE